MTEKFECPGEPPGALTGSCQRIRSCDPNYTVAGGSRKPPLRRVGTQRWADRDRDWLSAHPYRAHRLRMAQTDEHATASTALARQMRPGLRVRLGVEMTGAAWPDDENFLHATYDYPLESRTKTIWGRDVGRRARALAATWARRQ